MFKDRILSVMFILDNFSDFVEKTEKLLCWQDRKTSSVFLLVLIVAFFVVSFLPLRYFVIVGLLLKFNRGKTYYQRRFIGNQEVCKIEIRNFLIDNNLLKSNGNDSWVNLFWSGPAKKLEKLTLHMQDRLFILLPKNFIQAFPRPRDLIECVGYIDTPLALQAIEQNEFELRNNMKLYRKKPNPIVYLFNFVMNNITSMVYEQSYSKHMNTIKA
jgi:hypothetical protein